MPKIPINKNNNAGLQPITGVEKNNTKDKKNELFKNIVMESSITLKLVLTYNPEIEILDVTSAYSFIMKITVNLPIGLNYGKIFILKIIFKKVQRSNDSNM